jgi:hypothetical protein
VSIHATRAIQKIASDTVVSHCQPVSAAVAYVADEYIPSGNTAGHASPTRRRSATWISTGIHALATSHVTTVTGHTNVNPALWM